ncbi:integrase catalytic domain-containing protein [Trichonephila clavipes]|nr:integrase catalytic domain-containing protein [Trichonephila clavipes]
MCLYENDPNEIHMLIGADFAGRLLTGEIKQITENLVAIHTRLGWTLMGESGKILVGVKHCFLSMPIHGKFAVDKRSSPLTSCRKIAEKRLANCVKSLEKVGKLSDYEEVFNEWENEDIIEKVESHQEIDEEHYLPHRPVFKENSTTKVRPCFRRVGKRENSPSINDCLEKGPNLIELIPSLINRFRFGKFGVIADIKRAFLQIGSHNRISLKECPDHYKETAHTLLESFYVDNLVCSVNSKEKLDKLIVESQEILEEGKFELRGWEHNNLDPQTENTVPTERRSVPVLGLKWDLDQDLLSVDIKVHESKNEILTKGKNIIAGT